MNHQSIAKFVLCTVAVLSLAAIVLTSRLGFDYDFEKFFPKDDPETDFYMDFRSRFETDNDFIIIGLTRNRGIFDRQFLEKADRLTKDLRRIRHVESVLSPTELKEPVRDPLFGLTSERPLIRISEPENYPADSAFVFNHPEMVGNFFSEDGKSLLISLRHKQYLAKAPCDTLSQEVRQLVKRAGFEQAFVIGRSIGQTYYVNLMQTELLFFVSLSMVLIVLFLWIAFRTTWGVWVPLVVVLLSVLWLLGIMGLTGKEIDLMLTVLPTILFVVGMSDIVHLLARYFDELRMGRGKIEAITRAWREVGLATFLTSLTTAIGFLTLLTSPIIPIRDFGLYTAIGVFVAYALAYTVMPSVMIVSATPISPKTSFREPVWNRWLRRLFRWMLRNPRKILVASVATVLLSLAGIKQVQVNNFLLEDLRPDDPLRQEFEFFADKFSGGRPFELAIIPNDPGSDMLRPEVLRQVDELDEYLVKEYGVGSLLSPARIVRNVHRLYKGGSNEYYRLPESDSELNKLVRLIEKSPARELMKLHAGTEGTMLRISGKTGDLGSIEINRRNRDLTDFFKSNMPEALFRIHVTGTATLIDQNNSYLAENMMVGLLIAFGVIGVIVALMFKSIWMVLVSLIPNLLPLLMIGGLMGLTGIDLKVSTSIIFTIAFGIAVDDTIHFLAKFRILLGQGRQPLYALKRTFISTGKAIIVTSLILCSGFITLLGSEFNGTFYIGLLISLTLLFAVLADLILLPVLLMGLIKFKKIRT